MVVAFDFAGSGLSDGDYVSLGWYEHEDLVAIIKYLRDNDLATRIAIWGRSMGAATALMYGSTDPSIACLIVDSPFTSLKKLCMELVDKFEANIPNLMVKLAYKMVKGTVKKKAKFSME